MRENTAPRSDVEALPAIRGGARTTTVQPASSTQHDKGLGLPPLHASRPTNKCIALILVHPLLGRMVRGVCRTLRIVDKPRPFRIGRRPRNNVFDSLIRQRRVEVPARLAALTAP